MLINAQSSAPETGVRGIWHPAVQGEKSSPLAYKGTSCPCSAGLNFYKGPSIPGVWRDVIVPGMKDCVLVLHHLLPAEELDRTANTTRF